MSYNRRAELRIPFNRIITEFSHSEPFASAIVNLSARGMFTVRPVESGKESRRSGYIQIEIPVPEANDTVWATGELMFEKYGPDAVGSGILFKNISRTHKNLLRDIVEHRRQKIVQEMLQHIMWQKELGKYPTVNHAPMPAVTEHTVPLFRISGLNRTHV